VEEARFRLAAARLTRIDQSGRAALPGSMRRERGAAVCTRHRGSRRRRQPDDGANLHCPDRQAI